MMARNEAVQKLATAGRLSMAHAEDLYDSFFEKPVVPQYVADWYEEHKNRLDYDLWEYLVDWSYQKDSDFKKWMARDGKAEPVITLANMHQFGYEVEQEMKYTVTMKNVSYNGHPQFLCTGTRETFWSCGGGFRKTKYTRKELENANFGWVFDCPGVEVKEVE